MARKAKKNRRGEPAARSQRKTPSAPTPLAIQRLVKQGQHKQAISTAKVLHQQSPSAESEELITAAYAARLWYFAPGMGAEAKALMDSATRRYPFASTALEALQPFVAARHGDFAALLRPLEDPGIPPSIQRRIDDAVKQEVTDLEALAECPVLPSEHSLRVAAAALSKAFAAVTRGPVEDGTLALPELSRRSPLADWKLLIRAIAHFYRREDDQCETLLQSIDPTSVPARLAPTLHDLVSGKLPAAGNDDELVSRISGNTAPLRAALVKLDDAFVQGREARILTAVRQALRRCNRSRPDVTEKLKQRIWARCFLNEIRPDRVSAAVGGPALHDAAFWRMMARAMEEEADWVMAGCLWEEFRRNAIAQGWIQGEGPEEAAIYLRMLELLQRVDDQTLEQAAAHFPKGYTGFADFYVNQPQEVRAAAPPPGRPDPYFVSPALLFERAAGCDPYRETFRAWLDWAKGQPGFKTAEKAAFAWHRELPEDSAPLLHLSEASEKRNALKKALGYLEKAELRDKLNPDVKRGRLRLLIATAIRHLKSRKLRLAAKDIDALWELPETRTGDRPAIVTSLRALSSSLGGDPEASRYRDQVIAQLDDPTAFIVMDALARACGLDSRSLMSWKKPALLEVGRLARAVARACVLGEDVGFAIEIPAGWEKRLLRELPEQAALLEPKELRTLAEASLRRGNQKLGYAVSGLGLIHPDAYIARFLLLRARSLPRWEPERFEQCLTASAELARRERNMDLVKEAVHLGRQGIAPWVNVVEPDDSMSNGEIEEVLETERRALSYPRFRRVEPLDAEPCLCPACRQDQRAIDVFDDEPIFDEPFWDDEESLAPWKGIDPTEFPDFPPAMVEPMAELVFKYATEDGSLPPLDLIAEQDPALFDRLQRASRRFEDDERPPARGTNRRKKRRRRKPKKRSKR